MNQMFRVQTYPVQVTYGAIFVWHGKMISVTVHNLFYQPMDENIKTWTFRFPAKKNPLIRRRHFWICWPIVLQYDVKAICKMLSDMKFFPMSVRLTNQKPRVFLFVR